MSTTAKAWLSEATQVDRAVYDAIAQTPTPRMDGVMRRVSTAANHSRISMTVAAVLAATGGARGRRAAASGLISVAATSAIVNLVVKPLGRRRRPVRAETEITAGREVEMPRSRSFPSGHAAAAAAFATGAARELPQARLPLDTLAALVGYSRVHTGVHYPGDVIAGALLGGAIAEATSDVLERLASRGHRSSSRSAGTSRCE
jgi:membrane-associated phospholipid phosphatase